MKKLKNKPFSNKFKPFFNPILAITMQIRYGSNNKVFFDEKMAKKCPLGYILWAFCFKAYHANIYFCVYKKSRILRTRAHTLKTSIVLALGARKAKNKSLLRA